MRFKKILVIGSGKIASDCVRILRRDLEITCVEVIESSNSQFSMLKKACEKYALRYRTLLKKELISEAILEASQAGPLLIISANNRYLFPAGICELPDVEIINFHYGYLPRYRGMNIPTWVIYNNEPFTGVTWHYVTSEVDRGEIIVQQKILLSEDTTAYEVVRDGMRAGTELFRSFIPELLEKRISGKEILTNEHVYLNKCLPEDGKLDPDKDVLEIYRLLRSFDYGRTGTLRPLKVCMYGTDYLVEGYSLEDSGIEEKTAVFQQDRLVITGGRKTLMISLRKDDE